MAQQVSETPSCSSKKLGKVYMVLQKDFKDYISRREEDIRADADNITMCFQQLGFEVEDPLENCTKDEVIDHLTEVCKSDTLSEYECVLVFFVTHSPAAGILLCKDDEIYDEKIIGLMKEEKFKNLVKIFVFQASQATSLPSQGIQYDSSSEGGWVPNEANFFIIKSSFERESSPCENGSYFLKMFCQYMENIGKNHSLFNVMAAVLCNLKAIRTKLPTENKRNNILPEVTSTLLKPMPFRSEGKTSLKSSRYEVKQSIGKLIVFNDAKRPGAEKDVEVINSSFPRIGFKVEVNNNLKADDVRHTLEYGSECRTRSCRRTRKCDLRHKGDPPANYSDDTCLAVAIMGHGNNNHLQTSRGEMNIGDIISALIMKKNPKGKEETEEAEETEGTDESGEIDETNETEERDDLSEKPKLFFLQVCRLIPRIDPNNHPLEIDDTLVFHSCYHGFSSARHPISGSLFIQKLCGVIDEIPVGNSVPLIDILQEVQQRVVDELDGHQMPVIYSTLSKNLLIEKLQKE